MMKKSFKRIILLLTSIVLFAVSCKKPAEHSIRVNNKSTLSYQNITLGSLTFNDIKAGTATEYKAIPEGTYSIGGDITSNPFTISGTGKHKWSITIVDGANPETPKISVIPD